MGLKVTQIALIAGALLLTTGLVLAPRLPSEKRLGAETDLVDARISEAVALVENSDQPMQGIMMLRDILNEDSTNVDVNWHLAQFSLTSRQIENAEYRFEQVLQFDKKQKYPQAHFWLAQTKLDLGKKEEAIPLLEKYLTLDTDTVVLKGIQNMLYRLKRDSTNELN